MPTLLNDTKGLDPPVIVISDHKRISKKSFSPENITGSQVCQGKKEGFRITSKSRVWAVAQMEIPLSGH
jgi:hypothetical protein